MHSGAHGSKRRKGQADRAAASDDPLAEFGRWRQEVGTLLVLNWRHPPLCGPLRASFTFVVPRPQSRPTVSKFTTQTTDGVERKIVNPRWEGGDWIVRAEDWATGERVPCPVKPDLDRYTNAIMDQLTVARVWWDDAQVCGDRNTTKWYAATDEEPSLRLRVEAW
jgi:Holliday junction resolvase RusA-like endonuclease